MKRNLQISEEEKKYILSKYSLIKESTSNRKCVSGNCQNGKGKFEVDEGNDEKSVYEGDFVNGLRDGNGVFTYPNGDVYSGQFKNDNFEGDGIYKSVVGILSGNMTIYSGLWKSKDTDDKITPIPDEDDSEFVVAYGEDYTYKGYFSERGMNGVGYFIFVNDNDTKYEGMFIQTKLKGKIKYTGEDSEGNYIETEDLIEYHKNKKNQPIDDTEEETPKEVEKTDENVVIIPDNIKSKWVGCRTTDPNFEFREGLKALGFLTKMPEMGFAKFKGVVDGKNIEYNGCFDKYKMVRGFETGERGDFTGLYYSEDDSESYFLGDESKANKFMWGTLKDSDDYNFHDANWKYTGSFVDGKINGTSDDVPDMFKPDPFGKIDFSDGKSYSGDFKDGQIGGNGTFTFQDGMVLKGVFKTTEQEGIVISVTTQDNQYIPNIFDYNENYKQSTKKTEKNTIGAIKTSNFNGITKFKFKLESKKTGKSKEFNSYLPNVFIRITNLEDRKIFFESRSDDNGNFQIPNVPYGRYKLVFLVAGNRNELIYENSDYNINKENQKVSVPLKPTKFLFNDLSKEISSFEKSESREDGSTYLPGTGAETYDLLGMTDEEMREYLSTTGVFNNDKDWVSDLNAGRFEKKYGKVTSKEACLREFKSYANIIRKIQKNEIDLEILKKPGNDLQPTKNYLSECIKTYGNEITNEKDVKIVVNPPGEAYEFGVRLENKNKTNIYKDMGLSRTINKVITEHAEKKRTLLQESKIINNRLKFIVENYNLNLKSERRLAFNDLRNEKIKLISLGYNRQVVKESFIDVMKGLFGSSGQDPIVDFKKGLSEKLSAPIDLKVIANELDSAIIEEAFKTENPKDLILETILEKIKEKIDPQIDVVFQNISKKMEDFRSAVGGLQV